MYDASARALVTMGNFMVMSVDYRQGPEHKFPAAHDDAYAAYEWALKNASSINADPQRIAVGGESAGENRTVAVSLMARDKGARIPVGSQRAAPPPRSAFDAGRRRLRSLDERERAE